MNSLIDNDNHQNVAYHCKLNCSTDAVTPEECIQMLKEKKSKSEADRVNEMKTKGFPAYTTQVGWLGYSEDKVKTLCQEFIKDGFTSFKVKVGQSLQDDKKRLKLVRDAIGASNNLVTEIRCYVFDM